MESSLTSWSKSVSDKLKITGLLTRGFYERDTLEVARDLIGKVLIVRSSRGQKETASRIVEVEAYHGTDAASHCAKGETPRCSVMFGDPGVAYVYFIYGMYEMLNFVTERKGYPGAVLIRAVEPLAGLEGKATNGPGRLCRAHGIRLSHNGQALTGPSLFVADDGYRPKSITVTPRIGITRATEKPWRFFETGNPFVSRKN